MSGQLYEPVDMDTLLYYKEAKEGQILEEGITEAGSISSFIAAGTAYATHGINTIPFFIYYSMFGMQRVGDLVWAAADTRTRGFLLGGTAGRTTLAGEGLQHQDGHSHLLSLAVPNLISYDPAFAYEIAVIIEEGIRRMYVEGESVFYYITVMNETLRDAADARGRARRHPRRGCTASKPPRTRCEEGKRRAAQLLGSGAILPRSRQGRSRCSRSSTTSPPTSGASPATRSSIATATPWSGGTGCILARRRACPTSRSASSGTDGVHRGRVRLREGAAGCASIGGCRARLTSLGTDGFGRSENRAALRDFFEVDSQLHRRRRR